MRKYNKALDYMVLSMAAMLKGDHTQAARLFASAAVQADVKDAIKVLEVSNAHAFAIEAKARLTASDEFPFEVEGEADDEDDEDEEDDEAGEEMTVEGESDDPLDDVEDDLEIEDEGAEEAPEETPAVAMAAVLASMTRRKSR